jgi:SnoaL-like protein
VASRSESLVRNGRREHMRQANRRSTVSTRLPPTLARYFAATNSHDVDGMLVLFADGAVVKDEGREHRGAVAIREWMREAIARYAFEVEPTGVAEVDDKTVVTGLVSGSFPGTPVTLRHEFTLEDEKIVHLEIRP